jgi:inosose dehydratase
MSPRIGITPDSWGVWYAADPRQPSPEQYLREIQEAGYHWTELGPYGYLGTDAAELADSFAAHDLALTGGTVFTSLEHDAVEVAWPAVADVARLVTALGADQVIVIPDLWERDPSGAVPAQRRMRWRTGDNGRNANRCDVTHSHDQMKVGRSSTAMDGQARRLGSAWASGKVVRLWCVADTAKPRALA